VIQNISLINVNFPNPVGGKAAAPTAFVVYGEDLQNMRAADIQTYSLSLQRQFGSNWFVSIAGVGDIARHLPQVLNIDQPEPVPGYNFNPLLNTGNYSNAYFAPYQGYSTINYYTSGAYANWNALELNLRHPIGHNLFLTASYTWSHGLSTLSGQQFGIEGSNPQNSYNPSADYGNTSLNVPQVFTTSLIYTLPWLQTSTGWKRAVLGGWKFADVTSIQSGASLSPGLSSSHVGLATRPDLTGPVREPKTIQQWFSTSSFVQPAYGFFGNAGRGIFLGPGLVNFDMALYKDFRVSERLVIQFRSEFFNVFNHTNFNAPNANFGAGNFGQITSAKDPRIGEMALKVNF
jgi:hypothetical protein